MSKLSGAQYLSAVVAASALSLSDAALPSLQADPGSQGPGEAKHLKVEQPSISQLLRSDEQGNLALTIEDPRGVRSYNIQFSDSLSGGPDQGFKTVAVDHPVTGTGQTTWVDDGSLTGRHPSDAAVGSRFYRVEVNRAVDPTPWTERLFSYPGQLPFYSFDSQGKHVYLTNNGETDLHWRVESTLPGLYPVTVEGIIPARTNVSADAPYGMSHEWRSVNEHWDFSGAVSLGVRSDNEIFILDTSAKLIRIYDAAGTLWRGVPYYNLSDTSHIAFDSGGNFYVSGPSQVGAFSKEGALLREFGQGICRHAFDVAVDAQGNIYVSDGGARKVHKFDSAGEHLFSWESDFKGPARLPGIMGIVVDSLGYVYVADNHYRRLQKFDGDGRLLKTWGTAEGGSDWQLGEVFAISRDDRIFLAHEHSGAISVCNTDLERVGSVTPNYPMTGHQYMRDGAIAPNGTMYSIAQGAVYSFLKTTPTVWWAKREMDLASGYEGNFKFNSQGELFLLTKNMARELKKYSSTGRLLGKIDLKGATLNNSLGIDRQDRVYTYRLSNLEVYDSDLRPVRTISLRNQPFLVPGAIHIDAGGNITLLNNADFATYPLLARIDQDGNFLQQWEKPAELRFPKPVSLERDSRGVTYILASPRGTQEQVVAKFGVRGNLIDTLPVTWGTSPVYFALDAQDNLFVNSGNGFVKYGPDGERLLAQDFRPIQSSLSTGQRRRLGVAPNGDLYCHYDSGQMAVYSQSARPVQLRADHSQFAQGLHVGHVQILNGEDAEAEPISVPVKVYGDP